MQYIGRSNVVGKKIIKKVSKTKPTKVRIPGDLQKLLVPMDSLKLWKNNPRKNAGAVEPLAELIKEHGFLVPIIATKDGKIRAGNTRFKAAKALGMKQVPAIMIDFPSEAKSIAFALSDNKASEWSKWDPDLLLKAFRQQESVELGHLHKRTGFSTVELQGIVGTGLPDSPDGIDESALPTAIDPSQIQGVSDDWQRFIIAYKTQEDRQRICKVLGINGKKTVYTISEMGVFKKKG